LYLQMLRDNNASPIGKGSSMQYKEIQP